MDADMHAVETSVAKTEPRDSEMRFPVRWRDISIKMKILLIGVLIIAAFSTLIFAYILPTVERNAVAAQDAMIRDVVQSSISIVEAMNVVAGSGDITLEDAKEIARKRIREMRYGEEMLDSLWVIGGDGRMLAHPYVPALEGRDMREYVDSDGVRVFREAEEICGRSKSGYINFRWQRYDDARNVEPMRSYVESYQPWGWIIGSGFYLSDAEREVRLIRLRLGVIVVVLMGISLVALYLFAGGIARRLGIARSEAARMGTGDYSVSPALDAKAGERDETGAMLRTFRDLTGTMRESIGGVNGASEELSSAAESLRVSADSMSLDSKEQAAAAEEISATIEEITAETETIAGEASAQARRVAEVRILVDRLNDDLFRMNERLGETIALSDTLGAVSADAESSIGRMTSSMRRINASSREMSAIVGMIGDISERINLLSLNAAIEAARAGDAGRGFAVVSDEISKLADQTARSLDGISGLIRQNEREISDFSRDAEAVLDMTGSITGGIGKIGGMTDSFRETMNDGLETNRTVMEGFTDIARRAETIRSATREQRNAMDETAKSVSEITCIAQKTAESSESVADRSRELSALADTLKRRMAFFRID